METMAVAKSRCFGENHGAANKAVELRKKGAARAGGICPTIRASKLFVGLTKATKRRQTPKLRRLLMIIVQRIDNER